MGRMEALRRERTCFARVLSHGLIGVCMDFIGISFFVHNLIINGCST